MKRTIFRTILHRVFLSAMLMAVFASLTFAEDVANVPGEPTLFKVRDTSLEVTIDENGNTEETGYCIRITTPGGTDGYAQLKGTYSIIGATPEYRVKSVWGDSCYVSGLSPVTTYYLSVSARNADGYATGYSAVSTATTKGYAPLLRGDWDGVHQYHVHVTIQEGGNPPEMQYAILCIDDGIWFDGNGGMAAAPCYLTKIEWESVSHRDAQPGLSAGTHYRYRVRARDPSIGTTVDSADGELYLLAPPNLTVTEEAHDRAVLQWTSVSAAESYNVYYATASAGQLYFLAPTANTGYSDDIDGAPPSMVTGVYATTVSSTAITVSWTALSDPQSGAARYYRVAGAAGGQEGILSSTCSCTVSPIMQSYKIYRNGICSTTLSCTATTFIDTGLSPEMQYTYEVSAVSSDDLEGVKSGPVTGATAARDTPAPEDVMGIQTVSSDGTVIQIRFLPVLRRADGSSVEGYLRCYAVYRSASLNGPWEKILTISPGSATGFTDTYNGQLRYYRVKAVDIYGKESEGLMTVNTEQEACMRSADGQALIIFDDDAKENYLYEGTGKRIRIGKDEGASNGTRTCYTVEAYDADGNRIGGNLITGSRLGAQLVFFYGTGAGAQRVEATDALTPTLYWYNSVKWVQVNGEVNPSAQSISLRTKTLGRFAIQYAERSGGFRITGIEPKIFSPNETDTMISRARIYIENPNASEVTSAIFDLRGNVVRRNLPREMETVLYWDGRDTSGTIVPAGVYLYQVEAEGKTRNGTVVVAK